MGGRSDEIGTEATVSTGGIGRADARSYELTPGTMVGEYRIEGELGAGGMGKVYAAMHPVIAKRAAIKVLHPELSVNTEAVERFVQEARSVNQIGHPNIVDIFAFGALPDGRHYFVMEWLRGKSLRDRTRESMLPMVEALQILDTVGLALEAAHEKGIVHRDLKPDNIFLVELKGSAPTVKLLDFGIAKLLGNDQGRAEKTRTGNLLGTPAYISPEQARGYAVDHRTDIYALGALTYELMTNWLPFPSDNAADMIAQHLYEKPPLASQRNPNVPPALDALIVAMLAKDAAHRPSLETVRAQFRAIINHLLVMSGAPTGMLTPPPGSMSAQYTPPPAMPTPPPSALVTPAGPVSAYQTAPPTQTGSITPAKSKLPIILAAGLLAAGLGVGVFVAMRGGDDTKSDKPAPAATTTTTPAADPPKPAEPPKPVEPPKPAETKTVAPPPEPPPTPVETAKPVDSTPVETAKPVEPTKKPTKRPTKKPTTKPGGKPVVDDPDAPM